MTREEAINHGKEQLEIFGGEHKKFIEMAIEALQAHPTLDDVSNAYENGYKQGKFEAQQWIPVSKRLPEDKQTVLVWCPQYKNIYCAYLEKEQWWIFGAFVQIVPNEVVAWLPLPEPYTEE